MNGKIGEFTFELDSELSRIAVYQNGEGSEPAWYIPVGRDIDEKTFHYEIMDWYSKKVEKR
jgi:hypothetical protein|tara:strand:+ start:252 stop:434 length:183 start_codon:yes stop_codon:yes gene_type:complete